MYYKDVLVTLENYGQVFSSKSIDIRDEVRSMLLDGVNLLHLVDDLAENPLLLREIRLSTLVGLPEDFFQIKDYNVLSLIRGMYSKEDYDVNVLKEYLAYGFSPDEWSYILDWYKRGILPSGEDLIYLHSSLWEFASMLAEKGIPITDFCTGIEYPNSNYLTSIVRIALGGGEYKKFLETVYKQDVVPFISLIKNDEVRNTIVKYLTPNVSFEMVSYFKELVEAGVSADRLMAVDDNYIPLVSIELLRFAKELVSMGLTKDVPYLYYIQDRSELQKTFMACVRGYKDGAS